MDVGIVTRNELAPGQRYGVGEGRVTFLFAQKYIATTGLKG